MLLETRALGKSFGVVAALRDVSFSLAAGEVHGLMGENGAGKSTLIKLLTGFHQPTAGEILLDGRPVSFDWQGPRSISCMASSNSFGARGGASSMSATACRSATGFATG